MYAFTDKQKADLFDAGVTRDNVANYYATDDRCIESADEAFYTLIEWYGDHSLQGCGNNDAPFDYEAHDRAIAEDEALEASLACWMAINAKLIERDGIPF